MMLSTMSRQSRFVAFSFGIGVALPVLWLFIYWVFLKGNPDVISWIMSSRFDRVLIAIWPSWFFFVADPEERSVTIPLASVAVNGVLYGALGWTVWLGLYRHRAMLGVALAAVLIGWFFLFRWYAGA
jgi:hypothetical protein